MNLQQRDRITIERDGEEIEVFNRVNIRQPAVVHGGNPPVEKFDAEIGAGDSPKTPEAVTEWVANELWHEFGIGVADHGIKVIDPDPDEVQS